MTPNNPTKISQPDDRTFVMERVFSAPIDLVWKAWTEPDRIAQWWGPRGFSTVVKEMDVRPGGTWIYCMYSPQFLPEGQAACGKGVYVEVVDREKLVYDDYFSDENGNVTPNMPVLITTVLFHDLSGKTRVTSTSECANPQDLRKILDMGVEQGATETWDRLEELLA